MSVDLGAIAAALAVQAKVAGVRRSTSTMLGAPTMLPEVKVLDFDWTVTDRPSGNVETADLVVRGVLLLSKPGDAGRAVVQLRTLVPLLFVAARQGLKLGSSAVHDSWLESVSSGRIQYPPGGDEWIGADLVWMVQLNEPITTRTV